MSYARTLIKLREFQIFNTINAPYSHPGMIGTTVGAALDWVFAVLYPNSQPSVSTPGDLPLVGNTINDYRIVSDDGDGKAAGYRWEQREGDATPAWYKIHDMDWSSDTILAAFMDATQDLYVHKNGRKDLDASGNPVTGIYSGQKVYGGTSAGENLTFNPNSGDGTGPQSGYVQFDGDTRPTNDDSFDLGTTTERFRNLLLSGYLSDGTDTFTVAQGREAYDHSQVTSGNPHGTGYDDLSNQLGTLTLDGDVSGSIDLSTSGDKTLTTVVANDSHTHDAASTITNFDSEVYNYLKVALVDNDGLTFVFDDGLEEVTPSLNIDTSVINDIASPTVNRILVGNPAGNAWVSSDGLIELTGDVTGSSVYDSATDKWSINTTVASSNISGLGGVNLTNKTFTSAPGNPTTLTITGHGLQDGERLKLYGSILSSDHIVTVVNANTVTIAVNTVSPDSGYYIPEGGQLLFDPVSGEFVIAKEYEEIRLGELSGLTEDVLSIYVAKDGRSTGQTVSGGVSASENLDLDSTAHATKGSIRAKSHFVPYADAAYSGGWTGTNLGSSGRRWNDIYLAGEAKGLRAENVGSLPTPSGTEIGRLVYYSSNLYQNTGSAYVKVGSADISVTSKVANYTATTDDQVILCSGTFTVTLPLASSYTKKLTIKNTGTGTITIDGDGSETIDGSLTQQIFDQYHSLDLVSNGTGWYLL